MKDSISDKPQYNTKEEALFALAFLVGAVVMAHNHGWMAGAGWVVAWVGGYRLAVSRVLFGISSGQLP